MRTKENFTLAFKMTRKTTTKRFFSFRTTADWCTSAVMSLFDHQIGAAK
jgi:hypothetical protein